MMGVTQVEQDGFTSANVGNKRAQMRRFCVQNKADEMRSRLNRHPVMAADGVAYVTLRVCNGTNAARDTAYCAFLPVH